LSSYFLDVPWYNGPSIKTGDRTSWWDTRLLVSKEFEDKGARPELVKATQSFQCYPSFFEAPFKVGDNGLPLIDLQKQKEAVLEAGLSDGYNWQIKEDGKRVTLQISEFAGPSKQHYINLSLLTAGSDDDGNLRFVVVAQHYRPTPSLTAAGKLVRGDSFRIHRASFDTRSTKFDFFSAVEGRDVKPGATEGTSFGVRLSCSASLPKAKDNE